MTNQSNMPEQNHPRSNPESSQPTDETILMVEVTEEKALLREIKRHINGSPEMRMHEPRIRYNKGHTIKLHAEEISTVGDVIYYRCFDQPELYLRKKDVTPVVMSDTQNQSGSESEPAQPTDEIFIMAAVTENKALLREIKKQKKGKRPEMRIYEPRIRYNKGHTIKLHPVEISTSGDVLYYRCFDKSDLYVRKKDVSPVK